MSKSEYRSWVASDEPADRRRRRLERIEARLERTGSPRLSMTVILILTWAAWFLSSAGLLWLGVDAMAVRYPVAVGMAYLAFLGMLWVWLRVVALRKPRRHATHTAAVSLGAGMAVGAMVASGSLSTVASTPDDAEKTRRREGAWNGAESLLDLGDLGGSDAGGWVLILALVALLCALIVSGMMVATSPLLLAELLADGMAVMAVSRSIRRSSAAHWSTGAVRRTWLPVTITAVVFCLVGLGLQLAAPGSSTLGQAWQATHNHEGRP